MGSDSTNTDLLDPPKQTIEILIDAIIREKTAAAAAGGRSWVFAPLQVNPHNGDDYDVYSIGSADGTPVELDLVARSIVESAAEYRLRCVFNLRVVRQIAGGFVALYYGVH